MPSGRSEHSGFIEQTLASLARRVDRSLFAEEVASRQGLLQSIDPRVKVVGLIGLLISAALSHRLAVIGALFIIAVGMAVLSRVPLGMLARSIWLAAFLFTGAIALPSLFITPGAVIYRLPVLNWPITAQGFRSAAYLIARVETAATLSALLVLCTPWTHVLKALRVLRVPVVFVVILGTTYRYIFLMLQSARDMFEARQSRMVGKLEPVERRRVATSSVGVLLTKAFHLSNEVFLAMQSRGFMGEVHLLHDFRMRNRDWIAVGVSSSGIALALWFGRFQ
jgi:cobalt/nickel transport system permease protein